MLHFTTDGGTQSSLIEIKLNFKFLFQTSRAPAGSGCLRSDEPDPVHSLHDCVEKPELLCCIKSMQIITCSMRRHKPPNTGLAGGSLSASKLPLWASETHRAVLIEGAVSITHIKELE